MGAINHTLYFFKRVQGGSVEEYDITIPNGGLVISRIFLSGSMSPDAHVELVFEKGTEEESILLSCHGVIFIEPNIEFYSSSAGKKITIRLVNNKQTIETLGIGLYWIGYE